MDVIDGKSKAYTDNNFTSTDSPRVIDIFSDLKREATAGYLANDGNGSIQFEISYDGTNYGDPHILQAGEILDFDDTSINRIRLTHIQNTSYRIYAS